jgi:hypothetical protein
MARERRMRDPLGVGIDLMLVPSSGLAFFFSSLANLLRTWALPAAPEGC